MGMFQGNVAVKGIGCRASKKIKKGSLALRESPQLLIPEQDSPTFQGAEILVKAFIYDHGGVEGGPEKILEAAQSI